MSRSAVCALDEQVQTGKHGAPHHPAHPVHTFVETGRHHIQNDGQPIVCTKRMALVLSVQTMGRGMFSKLLLW